MSFIAVLLTILIIAMAQEVPQQRMLYEEWLLEEEWEDEDSWEDSEDPAPS
jgi:hypothetical protein